MGEIGISFKVRCMECECELATLTNYREYEVQVRPCPNCSKPVKTVSTEEEVINILVEGVVANIKFRKVDGTLREMDAHVIKLVSTNGINMKIHRLLVIDLGERREHKAVKSIRVDSILSFSTPEAKYELA
jgi:hypothetical protein